MRSWVKLPNRPVLTVVLALVWAGCLWIFYYPGKEATLPRQTFAYQRLADSLILIGMVRDEYDPSLVEALSISQEDLLEESQQIFDRATKRGAFPVDAARHWALLFFELDDLERAARALHFLPKGKVERDPGDTLLTQMIDGTTGLSAESLSLLAKQHHEGKRNSLPDWYLLARHGGDEAILAWLEDRGRQLIRRGIAADVLSFACILSALICSLRVLLRRRDFPAIQRRDRLERSWKPWRFFQEFVTAEVLGLLTGVMVSLYLYDKGYYDLGILLGTLTQATIALIWMFSCLMPGLRSGWAYFLPEFKPGPRSADTPARSHPWKSVFLGFAGFGLLILLSILMQLTEFGSESLGDIISYDELDRLPAVWVGFFIAVILAPIAEEILFRGFLFGALRVQVGPILAALISSAIFAAVHGYSFTGLVFVFVFGLVFAGIYQKTGSLLPGMIAHGMFNLVLTSGLVGWYSLH